LITNATLKGLMLDEIFNENNPSYLSMDINLLHNAKFHIYSFENILWEKIIMNHVLSFKSWLAISK
jgi:hypothetical protein